MEIKILVATHKEYPMPTDPIYLPIHAGAAVHEYSLPYISDDTGENISEKNRNYCELTAVYWAWKNLEADYIGLCHYRRLFCNRKKEILNGKEAEALLAKADLLLPRPRKYVIETNYSHYAHAHREKDLKLTREIISSFFPQDLPAFDCVMNRTAGHRFNMFLMKKEDFQQYCEWLFKILFEVEKRTDLGSYDEYNARLFGFLGERLLDVWIEAEKKTAADVPYVFLEHQNWIRKGLAFIYRKYRKE